MWWHTDHAFHLLNINGEVVQLKIKIPYSYAVPVECKMKNCIYFINEYIILPLFIFYRPVHSDHAYQSINQSIVL